MSDPAAIGLAQRIRRLIEAAGPISLAEYMHIAMADPKFGYYANQRALGQAGDFITSPEISQMFGELLGVWCASVWQAIGAPRRFVLAEAGPGRGTLMVDLLRAAGKAGGFLDAAQVRLIETSPLMRKAQKETLSGHVQRIGWVDRLEDIEAGPIIVVANEFLDVLPVRQFVKADNLWRERCIGIGAEGQFVSMLGAGLADPSMLPQGHDGEPAGAVFEWAPAREAWVEGLALRLGEGGGAGLLIDYGHAASGFGDTFQAVRGHAAADQFAEPGSADLTSHVDFQAIALAARRGGATASGIMTQGAFLLSMGLRERAATLGANRTESQRQTIRHAVERLAGPSSMGSLFKVIAIAAEQNASAMMPVPPFANPADASGRQTRD